MPNAKMLAPRVESQCRSKLSVLELIPAIVGVDFKVRRTPYWGFGACFH